MQLVTFERAAAGDLARAEPEGSLGGGACGYDALEPTARGTRRLGAIIPAGAHAGAVLDLNRALAVKLASEDAGAPEAEADSLLPCDMLGFLRRLESARDAARDALEFALAALERYDGPDLVRAGVVAERRRVRLCAPLPRPGKIVGVAHNYPSHAQERGGERPVEPVLFLKAASAVIGPEDEIVLPTASSEVDFEGELAAVIGRSAREVPVAAALECVAGYCAANDVSARDFQGIRGQRFIGKSCDTFAPIGPVLVTADEIDDPQDLALRTFVSGEPMQSANTKEMTFPVARIVAFASRLMTLEPGDVILTGTPSGVGATRKPPRWLRDGDVVEVAVQGIGRLRNYVRDQRPPD